LQVALYNSAMAYKRKSWSQKWEEAVAKPDLPKVIDCPEAGTRFVVPNPAEVEAIVKDIPKGKVLTMAEIAEKIAAKHGVPSCCPMTTGIFAWILAHKEVDAGDSTSPWWRVVKKGGELNLKYPGAPELQKELLESEGHWVERKGSRWIVD